MINEIDRLQELYDFHNDLVSDFKVDNVCEAEDIANWKLRDTIEWLNDNYTEEGIDEKFNHISGYWIGNLHL